MLARCLIFCRKPKHIREGDWKIAPLPKALERRRTEITGPVEAKMIINAYNSGADSYMTDFRGFQQPQLVQPDSGSGESERCYPPQAQLCQ
jgi:hypothetical protein